MLTVSPAAGVFWYCPPILLGLAGLWRGLRTERPFAVAVAVSGIVFFCFVASLSFAKGDPAWGPRYLTPLYAVLWLFVDRGAIGLRTRDVGCLLILGFVVQVMALTVDPERLHVSRSLPVTFGAIYHS